MDQNGKNLNSLEPTAYDPVNMAERATVFMMSIPVGQYVFQKIDKGLQILEQTAGWLQSVKENVPCKRHLKDHKNHQNGHANSEEAPLPYDTRPLLWILFYPFLLCFIFCHFYINIILFIVNKPLLKSEDIKHSVQKLRRHFANLQLIGSKNIRNRQKMTAQRLKQNPPQLNIICRTFSKWPLRLFVRRLRKILNFLGVITLPLPGDLQQNSNAHQNDKNELIKNNGALTVQESPPENSDSEESYNEEYYEDPVKKEPTRRVSVTVQEIIMEENEEESITNLNLMKDQFNKMEADQETESSDDVPSENPMMANNFGLTEPVMVN